MCPSSLKIEPNTGRIEPSESKEFFLNLIAKEPINFECQIEFILEDCSDTFSVPVSGRIMARELTLLSFGKKIEEEVIKIDFGDAYYATSVCHSATLYNNCPTTTNFVVILASDKHGSGINVSRFDSPAALLATSQTGYPPNLEHGQSLPHSHLIAVHPNQGVLEPFEKRKVSFVFTPKFTPYHQGWQHNRENPYTREYTMCMHIIPANPSLTTEHEGRLVEVAVRAVGQPVELELKEAILELGLCEVNKPRSVQTELTNQSRVLPIQFRIPHVTNLVVTPSSGKLEPNSSVPIKVTFTATSVGKIEKNLKINAIGTCKQTPMAKFESKIIHKLLLKVTASCRMSPKPFTPIGPQITTPNDLPRSIKPHDRTIEMVTQFTSQKRHTYIDSDYTMTTEEICEKKMHKNRYVTFLRESQTRREDLARDLNSKKFINTQDLGIVPLSGISPPDLRPPKATEFIPKPTPIQTIGTETEITSIRTIFLDESELLTAPITSQQKKSVKIPLTPQELISVKVSPTKIDFGEVAVSSHLQKQVSIINYTEKVLMFSVIGDEYFSYPPNNLLVPGQSETTLSLEFHTSKPGFYEHSISYTINSQNKNHFLLTAKSVEPYLNLLTDSITLTPPLYSSISTGLRHSFSLVNPLNTPIEFYWEIVSLEKCEVADYTIYPSVGIVPPFGELQCEAICAPNFSTPEIVTANVYVNEGQKSTMSLKLDTGIHECVFLERRVLFGDIPISIKCSQECHVYNSGPSNAYYKLDAKLAHLGMSVSPSSGVVPAGGVLKLNIEICPPKSGKFDVPIILRFKQGSTISIRASGNVIKPIVDTDVPLFKFGGVYCGAKGVLPFALTNKSAVLARLTFDFIDHKDFSVSPAKSSEKSLFNTQPHLPPNVFTVDVPPNSTLKAKLLFTPLQVASYDFVVPVFVNSELASTPPSSPWPPSANESQTFYLPKIPDIPTPSRRILATSLEAPLLLSTSEIAFMEPEVFLDTTVVPTNYKQFHLTNVSNRNVEFLAQIKKSKNVESSVFNLFDTSMMPLDATKPFKTAPNETTTILISFSPFNLATFKSQLAIFITDDTMRPFATVPLFGEVVAPRITIEPPELVLTNVPLDVSIRHTVTCKLIGYSTKDSLYCKLPLLPKGVKISIPDMTPHDDPSHFKIANIEPCFERFDHISLTFTVHSNESCCLKEEIVFSDTQGNQTSIPLYLSIENCVFSLYQFFATQTLSNNFEIDSISGVPHFNPPQEPRPISPSNSSIMASNISTLFGRFESSLTNLDTLFLTDVRSAVCRWLTYHGWPKHYFPIPSPTHLGTRDCSTGPFALSIGKYRSKGILEIVQHLWGKAIPDVPVNTLIHYPENERIVYKYQMFTAILAVLQVHGAHLPHVSPEHLLVPEDHTFWFQKVHGREPESYDLEIFSAKSDRAWIDILLQTIKVFVLVKVSINPIFADKTSNVYSKQELTILAWLNNNFQKNKHLLIDMMGDEIVDRKVTNFDLDLMDGIVLGCTLLNYLPHLKETHLNRFYLQPLTPEHCLHNASKIFESFQSISLDFDVTVNDIILPNPVFMLLLCIHLFLRLPSYWPNKEIFFEGTLSGNCTPTTYELKIENPSPKTLVYNAFIKGFESEFFTLPKGASIKVPPKDTVFLPVSYQNRFLSEKRALLLLIGDSSTNPGSVLSFNLIGKVSNIIPLKILKIKSLLYQQQVLSVPIDRMGSGTFEIQVFEADRSLYPDKQTNKQIPLELFDHSTEKQVNLFHPESNKITLHSKNPSSLQLTFIPFYQGPRYCILLFTNFESDQFVVAIDSHTSLPLPTPVPFEKATHSKRISTSQASAFGISETNEDTFLIKCAINDEISESLVVSAENVSLEEALYSLARHNMAPDEFKYRMLTGSMSQATLNIATRVLNIATQPTKTDLVSKEPRMTFSISTNSDNFIFPPEVTLEPASWVQIPFRFKSSEPGQFRSRVVLKNSHETRVYLILALVVPSESHPIIEMECPALKNVTQKIPVLNPSKKEWHLDVAVRGIGFSGSNVFVIKALESGSFSLNFRPTIPGNFKGEVIMINRETGTEHHFEVLGRSLVPESMGELVVLCRVGEPQTCAISVPNYSERTANFTATTNLQFSSGHNAFSVDPNSVTTYELLLTPFQRGTYTGTIVFEADAPLGHVSPRFGNVDHPDGVSHRVWYTIKVFVSPGPPCDTIAISKPLFSKNLIAIKLKNPHKTNVFSAKVNIDGEGLTGPLGVKIEPGEQTVLNLTFSPIRTGRQEASVVVTETETETTGDEIWYQLELTGTDPEPIICPTLESPLGQEATHSVVLHNPLDITTRYEWRLNQLDNFYVFNQPQTISVPPQNELEVQVRFKPSTLGGVGHSATLAFESKDLGTLFYHLKGVGLAPGELDSVHVYSEIGLNAAKIIHFKNPTNSDLLVDVSLPLEAKDTMDLLLKDPNRIPITPFGNLDIPICFTPSEMTHVLHVLNINAKCDFTEDLLIWSYPIHGHPTCETHQQSNAPILQSASRVRTEVCLILRPDKNVSQVGVFTSAPTTTHQKINESRKQVENVKFRLTTYKKATNEFKTFLERCLGVKFIGAYQGVGSDTNLAFELVFYPYKGVKGKCLFEVEFEGCLWQIILKLHSTQPNPDDVITIKAKQIGGKPTSVNFNLNSGCDEAKSFTAHLDANTDPAFNVTPLRGVLPAKGANATTFTVSYHPVKYGRPSHGLVIIETDNMLWTYALKGETRPKPVESDTKIKQSLPQLNQVI